MKQNLVLLTWNSASGKSSIWRKLKEQGWKEVLSFTTRVPRGDYELDEYVFLTEKQFKEKQKLGHFIESIEYNWHYYALSAYMPYDNMFAIVNPHGRTEVEENQHLFPHSLTKFFIDIDDNVRLERLKKRGDSLPNIKQRMLDNFKPTKNCVIVNGEREPEDLAEEIEAYVNN